MNKIHNVIWSTARNAWIVVAEGTKTNSKARTKGLKVMVALVLVSLSPATSFAATLPQGGSIIIGDGSIISNGSNQLIIKQTSDKLGINWQSFNIGADGHVIFDQPGASSIALNRVIGSDGSSILGKIDSNGQVFLINPNGVIFGKNAKVNVGGLVASTMAITDDDFKNGNYKFQAGENNGQIVNHGTLHASEGGYVALLGKTVKNTGVIKATLGTVTLAAGSAVTLDFAGDGLIKVQVDQSAVNALVDNHGLIQADGGNVFMTARASNALLDTVVNNEGIIRAQTIGNRSGKIYLDGGTESGTVMVAGTLDASAPVTGDGGFIETSGPIVQIADGAQITTLSKNGTTGDWLVDPTDFTISSGTGPKTTSGIGAKTLMTNLATTNVELKTSASGTEKGNIYVNSDISWAENTKLTLTAHGEININANINVNGDKGKLGLNYSGSTYNIAKGKSINLVGANTQYSQNGENAIILRTVNDLLKLDDSSNEWSIFALGGNIDASATSSWNNGLGYKPAVMDGTFYGHLSGLGHSVTNLFINRPNESNVGLIGKMESSKIYNVGVSGSVVGKNNTGLLVGYSDGGVFRNISTSGLVSGGDNVGGVAGFIESGNVTNVNSSADVNGLAYVGGVLGSVNSNSLNYLFSTGNVSGLDGIGGVVGRLEDGTLNFSYALGNVTGRSMVGGVLGYGTLADLNTSNSSGDVAGSGDAVGGLVGQMFDGEIAESFSTSNVTGVNDVGGLAGKVEKIDLENSYASGSVAGSNNIGGLVGSAKNAYLTFTYSTGKVTGASNLGGLIGAGAGGDIKESYWDTTKSEMLSSAGGVGKIDLTDASIFSNWNIALEGGSNKTWRIYDGSTGPLLRAFMGTGTATAGPDLSTTYNGKTVNTGDVAFGGTFNANITDSFFQPKNGEVGFALTSDGQAIRNAGTYVLDGFYSTQFGYDITQAVQNNLVVEKARLDIDAIASGKTYDGNTDANVSFGDNRFGSDDLVITGTGSFEDKNAGFGKAVSVNGISVAGDDASNYYWDASSTTTADISKANLNITATGSKKVYDGSTGASVSFDDNRIGSDDIVVSSDDINFSDKNAGQGKTILANGIVLSGEDAKNYEWNASASTTGDISKATLVVGAIGHDKVYDGTTGADVSYTDNRIANDDLIISSSGASFGDKNAGTGKVVTLNGISVGGEDAANYEWNTTTSTTADIAKAHLKITADGVDKTYNGSTAAGVTLGDDRIAGDDLAIGFGDANFSDKNAGVNKTVTVNGITVTGEDAQNYSWDAITTSSASIWKAILNVTGKASGKTYDGSSSAVVTLGDDRVLGDDLVINAGASNFADKNAGMNKLVTVEEITLGGADAQNYTFNTSTTAHADIAKASLVIKADNASKMEGTEDGKLNWNIESGDLFGSDSIIGSLGRVDGETVGVYEINQGDLTAGFNYEISVVPGLYEITKKPAPAVNVELEEAKSIISTINTTSRSANSSEQQMATVDSSAIAGDYRLLNLGMMLPDDFTFDEVTSSQIIEKK